MSSTQGFLCGKTQLRFDALQAALVPRSAEFTSSERARSNELINQLLAQQDARSQRQLKLFLVLIDLYASFRFFKSFRRLGPARQNKVLSAFFDSPIPLIRKGFWGLNTLARLGVYSQPALHTEIGYLLRPNPQPESIQASAQSQDSITDSHS